MVVAAGREDSRRRSSSAKSSARTPWAEIYPYAPCARASELFLGLHALATIFISRAGGITPMIVCRAGRVSSVATKEHDLSVSIGWRWIVPRLNSRTKSFISDGETEIGERAQGRSRGLVVTISIDSVICSRRAVAAISRHHVGTTPARRGNCRAEIDRNRDVVFLRRPGALLLQPPRAARGGAGSGSISNFGLQWE